MTSIPASKAWRSPSVPCRPTSIQYYFLLGVAGFYHGLNGLGIALGRLGLRTSLSTAVLARVTAAGALLTLLALGGLGGWYYDVGEVQESEFAVLTTRIAAEVFGVSLTP